MRGEAALRIVAALGCALFAAGCGAQPTAVAHPSQAATPGVGPGARCFPDWEREDMRLAAGTKLPVQTVLVSGSADLATRVTTQDIAAWLGDPPGTSPTAASLRTGWAVSGRSATRGTARLVAEGGTLYLEERVPSEGQTALLTQGLGAVPSEPLTLVFQGAAGRNLAGALRALNIRGAGPGGIPLTYYTAATDDPAPTRFSAPGGGPPVIDPAGMLTRQDVVCPPAGSTGRFMGPSGGYVAPLLVASTAPPWSGFAYGFRDGEFMVDWNQGGYDHLYWYRIPGLRVPGSLESGTP